MQYCEHVQKGHCFYRKTERERERRAITCVYLVNFCFGLTCLVCVRCVLYIYIYSMQLHTLLSLHSQRCIVFLNRIKFKHTKCSEIKNKKKYTRIHTSVHYVCIYTYENLFNEWNIIWKYIKTPQKGEKDKQPAQTPEVSKSRTVFFLCTLIKISENQTTGFFLNISM